MSDTDNRTCSTDGCTRPPRGPRVEDGMCTKCWKRMRETLLAMGLWESKRPEKPRKPDGPRPYRRDTRAVSQEDCIIDPCPRPVGPLGGDGRCSVHFGEYRDECVARGEQCPMTNRQREEWVEPGFHIEDWPADQHAGLSIDGKCSALWGCEESVHPKAGRGLCLKHVQQWRQAYKRRNMPVPKRQHGNPHPNRRMPDDDTIVETMRVKGSYTATAKALGFAEGTFRDYRLNPAREELQKRLEEVWRHVVKPRQFSDEERKERAKAQCRAKDLKRRLVPQQRIDLGGVTEADAAEAVRYALHLETQPCAYCGRFLPGEMQIDHIEALTRGGSVLKANLTSACRDCNMSKSNRDVDEFLAATVDVRAARYAEWLAKQPLEPGIEVLAIETGIAPSVSTSDGQLCLGFSEEALRTSGVANAGPRRGRRAGAAR